MLLAGTVLAVMILPIVVALSRNRAHERATEDREAARALGATRWQVVRTVVVPGARTGIEAAVMLALGRALGETFAVAMVIGNNYALPTPCSPPGPPSGPPSSTISGRPIPGSTGARSSASWWCLLAITVLVNVGGQLLLRRRLRAAGAAS